MRDAMLGEAGEVFGCEPGFIAQFDGVGPVRGEVRQKCIEVGQEVAAIRIRSRESDRGRPLDTDATPPIFRHLPASAFGRRARAGFGWK